MGFGNPSQSSSLVSYTVARTEVTTVTTTNGWATVYPWQHKCFYVNGLFWLFYCAGAPGVPGNHVFRTSADGASWSDATTVRASIGETAGHRMAYHYDGSFLHYAYGEGNTGAGAVYYRRATLNTDGTVTWSAVEQTVFSDLNKGGAYLTVLTDTTGTPWIGCIYYTDPAYGSPRYPRVYKSSKTDGTWTTDTGFPKDLNDTVDIAAVIPVPIGVALTAGKVFWCWSKESFLADRQQARVWDGAAWGDVEVMTTNLSGSSVLTLAAEGDGVHFAYLDGTTWDGTKSHITYGYRNSAGVYAAESQVTTTKLATGGSPTPALVKLGGSGVRVIWEDSATADVQARDVYGHIVQGTVRVLSDETGQKPAVTQNPLQGISNPATGGAKHLYICSGGAGTPWTVLTFSDQIKTEHQKLSPGIK